LQVQRLSQLYETEPWGYAEQPRFLNMALEACTDLEPLALLDYLKEVEANLGREPNFRNGPRPIDLDIIFYDELVLEGERLQVPHPRLRGRGFALAPLSELCPDYLHPVLGMSVAELLAEVDLNQAGVKLAEDEPALELPRPRFLFVTGRLAESWLQNFLAELAPRLGFDYKIATLNIDVAAFITCRFVAEKLLLAPEERYELDLLILPGFAGGEIGAVEQATGLRAVRGPTELTEIEPFLAGLVAKQAASNGQPHYYTEEQLREMQSHLTDPNIRIYTDGARIFAFNNEIFGSAEPTEKEIRNLFRLLKIENAAHAFYLGREFYKASICIKLGRPYRQDREIEGL
jgi:2-amino-4-hydroxy-6-hydroxymethyldihydropteridine diphosphokinase